MMKFLSLLLSFSLIISSITPSIAQINQPVPRPHYRQNISLPKITLERDGVQQTVANDEYKAKVRRSAFESQFTRVEGKHVPILEEMSALLGQMQQAAQNEEQPTQPQDEMLSLEEFEKVYRDANLPELKKALQKAHSEEERERYKKAFEELLDDTSTLAYQEYVTQYGAWKARQERAQAQAAQEFKKYLRALCDKAATIKPFVEKGYRTDLVMPDRPTPVHGSVDPISVFLPSMYEAFGEEVVTRQTREKASAVLRERLEAMNKVSVGTQALLQNAHALAVLGTQEKDAFAVAHVLLAHFNDPGVAPVFINTLGADLVAMKDVAPGYQPLVSVLLNAKNKELTDLSIWDVTPLKLENWVKAVHELTEGSEFATKTYINSLYKDNEPNPACDNKPCANHNSAWMDLGLDLAKAAEKDESLRNALERITEELISLRRGKDGNPQLVTHNNFFLVGLLSNGFKLHLKGKGPHDYYNLQGGVSHSEGNQKEVQAVLAQIKALGLTPSEYVAFVLYHQGYIDLDPATARYVRDWLTPAVAPGKLEALGMRKIGHTSREEVENYEMWQKVQSNFAFADKVLAFVAEFIVFWVLTDGILAAVSKAVRFGTSFVRAVRLSTALSRTSKGSFTGAKLVRFMKIAGRISSGEKMALKVGGKFSTGAAIKGGATQTRVVEVTAKSITQQAASMAGKNIFTYDGMTYFVARGFKNVLVRVGGRVEVQVVEESLSVSKIAQRFGVAAEDVLEVTVKDGKAVGKALDWLQGGGKVAQQSATTGLNYTSGGAGVHQGTVSAGVGAGAGVTEGITPLTLQATRVTAEAATPLVPTVSGAATAPVKATLQTGKWWQRGWKWLDETVIHWRPLNSANPGLWRGAWDRTNYFLRIQAPDFFSQIGQLATTRQGATVFGTSLTPAFAASGLNAAAGTALVAEANMARNAITVAEMGTDLLSSSSLSATTAGIGGRMAATSQNTSLFATMADAFQVGTRAAGATGALSFNLSPWWAPENQQQTPLQVGSEKLYQNWWRSREDYLTAKTKAAAATLQLQDFSPVSKPLASSNATKQEEQLSAASTGPENSGATGNPLQGEKGVDKSQLLWASAAAAAAILGAVATGEPTVALAGMLPIGVGLFKKGKKDAGAKAEQEGDQVVSISRPLNWRQKALIGVGEKFFKGKNPSDWYVKLIGQTADVYRFSYRNVVYNTKTKDVRLANDEPLGADEQQFRVSTYYGFIAPPAIAQKDLEDIVKKVTEQKQAQAKENHTILTQYQLDQAIEEAKEKHIFSIMTRKDDEMAKFILENDLSTRGSYVWIFASAASEATKIKAFHKIQEKGWKSIALYEVLAMRAEMMKQTPLEIKINAEGQSEGSFNLGQAQIDNVVARVNARAQEENKGQLVPQNDPILSQGLTDRELTSIDAALLTGVLRPVEEVEDLLKGSTHETRGGNTVYEKVVPVYLRLPNGDEMDKPRLYLTLNKPFIMPRGFHLVLDESGHFKVAIANLREVEATSWRQPYNKFWKFIYKVQPDFLDKLPWVVNNPKRLRDWDSPARKRVFETPLKASELTALNYILSQRTDQVAVLPTAEADQFESVMNLVAIVAGADLGASLSSQMKKTISVLALVLLITGFGYLSPKIANWFKGSIKRNGSYKAFQTGFLTMFGLSLAGMTIPGALAAAQASGVLDGLQAFFTGGMFGRFNVGSGLNLAFATAWMMAAIITASVFSTLAGPTLKSGYPDNTVFSSKNMGFTTMKGLSRFGVAFLGGALFKIVTATTGVDLNWSLLVPVMGVMSLVGLKKLKNSRIYTEHVTQQREKKRQAAEQAEEEARIAGGELGPVDAALGLAPQKADAKKLEAQAKAESERKYKETFAKPLSPITKRLGLIYLTYAFVNSVVIGALGGMLFSSPTALLLTGAGLFISWLVRKGADKLIKSRAISEDQLTGLSLPLMALGVLGCLTMPFGSPEMLASWLAMFVATPTFGVSENTRMMNYVAAYYKAERAKINKDPSLTEAEKEKRIKALRDEENGQKLNASAAYNKYNAWGIKAVWVGIALAIFRDFGIMNIAETMKDWGRAANDWGIKGSGYGVILQHALEKAQEYSLAVMDVLRDIASTLRIGEDYPIYIQQDWTDNQIAAQQAKAPMDFAVYRLGMILPAITSVILVLKNKGMIKEGWNRIVSSVILTQQDIAKGENIPQKLNIDFKDVGGLTAEVSKEVDDLNTAVRAFINSRTSEERLQGWANRMVWVNNRLKALVERSPLVAGRLSGELLKMKELSDVFYEKILVFNQVSDALLRQGMQIKESFAGITKVGRNSKVTLTAQFVYLPEVKLSFLDKLAQWFYRLTGWGKDPAKEVFSRTDVSHYELALMNIREMNTMLKEAQNGTITDNMFSSFQGLYNEAVDHLEAYLEKNAALGQGEIDSRVKARKEELDKIYRQFMNEEPTRTIRWLQPAFE